MKRILVYELTPGMITAEDVYSYSDQLIIPKGATLTEKAISKLEFYAIAFIRVEDELDPSYSTAKASSSAFLDDESSAPSYKDRVRTSEQFKQFKDAFEQEVRDFKTQINEVITKNVPLDVDKLFEDSLNLMSMGNGSFSIFDMLHSMRENDDETFAHCLNVGLFCNIFAGWLHLNEEQTKIATLCGLLHDIGKTSVSEDILSKEASLSKEEYKVIKTHAHEGFNFLKDLDIDSHIKNAALMHHERCDGSGYPFALTASKIDPYAKMVAIADVYDAMTSSRSFRKAHSPFIAISTIESEGFQKYETKFLLTFLENVMNTFIGNRVRLSDGREGEIVFVPKNSPSRPMINLGDSFIDLSQDKSVDIECLV